MNHKSFIIFSMLLSSVLLSGCWDRTELQDLDIVSAIGIDKGGDNVENKYRVTVQIINEAKVGGASGQGVKSEATPVTTYSATGSTLVEAISKIAPKSPQSLYFPHVQLMVIGEELARKKGIQDLFDFILRNPQFRGIYPVVVIRNNTSENLLKITTPLEGIPVANVVGGLESTKKNWGIYPSTRVDHIIQQLRGGAAILTGVQILGDSEEGNKVTNIQQISPKTSIEIRGIAIFKNGKLKKWLEKDVARGATWLNNELKKTIINLNCEKQKNGVAVEVMPPNTKVRVETKNKKPVIFIQFKVEGHISEVHCSLDLSKPESIAELEKQMKNEIKEEVMMAIETAKEQKIDIFHFGKDVYREDPKLWMKIKNNWSDEIFPETEVNVNVQAFIRRTGLQINSNIK